MERISYKVILPTSTKYLDITEDFLKLLRINWPEGYKNVILSISGKRTNIKFIDESQITYNPAGTALTNCVKKTVEKVPADFYFIFLGDAFIIDKVNNDDVVCLLNSLRKNKINYCRLLPKPSLLKRKLKGENFRFLNSRERYGHTFTAFIANKQYVLSQFTRNSTDREFELYYLKMALDNNSFYFKNDVVLVKNIFHILGSIVLIKGKWNPNAINYLKKKYPEITFSSREMISRKHRLILKLQKFFWLILPNKVRLFVKRKLKVYFDTDI